MKIIVALPSKAKNDPLMLAGFDYLKRLRRPFKADPLLLSPKKSLSAEQVEKNILLEGRELLQKSEGFFRIALCEGGKEYDSKEFAKFSQKIFSEHANVAFLIGGAHGLSQEVIKKSATLSLSKMTMPHRMAFLTLCEQLYRAQEINCGSAYHK